MDSKNGTIQRLKFLYGNIPQSPRKKHQHYQFFKKCLNTSTGIIISNENFFQTQIKRLVPVRTMVTSIIIRKIGANKHDINKYAIVSINIIVKDTKKNVNYN